MSTVNCHFWGRGELLAISLGGRREVYCLFRILSSGNISFCYYSKVRLLAIALLARFAY